MRLVGFDEDCVDEELVGFLAGGCDDVVVAVFAGLDFRAHGDGLAPVYPDEGDDFAEGGSVVAGFDVGLFAFGGTEVVRVDLADVLVGGRVGEGKSRGERGYREKQDRDEKSHGGKFRGREGKSNWGEGDGGVRGCIYKERFLACARNDRLEIPLYSPFF